MKAKPYQVSALAPQIKKGFKGAFVFGQDLGIVQEVSEKIASYIVPNLNDDLNVIKITPQKLKEIPTILLDEGNMSSFLGGRKLIWVKEGDHLPVENVQDYLAHLQTDAFLLISAGNLMKNSLIRNFCESEQDILTIVCYLDEAKNVAGFIQETLEQSGIRVMPSAMPLLVERLSENRLITKQELSKLISYLGDKKTVEAADVMAIITDTQNASKEVFCYAVTTGDRATAEKEYHIMLENGEEPVGIIRILFNYFNKLLDASESCQKQGPEAALKKLMKPAQFRWESSFRKQIQIWKKEPILKVLNLLIESEKQAKSTGLPADLILDRVIIQITGVVKKLM